MPQALGDQAGVFALRQQEAGVTVPQIVEADRWDARPGPDGIETSDQVSRQYGLTEGRSED